MIGIYGGTFDPIHYGHLRTALDVMEALALDQVRFLPLRQAVHRDQPLATPAQRLAMVSVAVAEQPGFAVDETELEREGPSYMIDTLRHLRLRWPDTPLCLLLGGDAFHGLSGWRDPEAIMALCHLIVMQRPGYRLPEEGPLATWVEQRGTQSIKALRQSSGGRIFFLPVTQLDISATDIRDRIGQNRSPRFLLPDGVLRLLHQERIYAEHPTSV